MPLSDDPWLMPAYAPAVPILVYRVDAGGVRTLLPNVRCLEIERSEGTDPGRASFRYDLDSGVDGAPGSIEEAMSSTSAGAYLVGAGNRVLVSAIRPDSVEVAIFDGFALEFGFGLEDMVEDAHFSAIGVAIRAWDTPIDGAFVRSAANPSKQDGNVQTQRPATFNPEGLGNATASGSSVVATALDGTNANYPAFIDPAVIRQPAISRVWTVPMALAYLLRRCNPTEEFIRNPVFADLDNLLTSRVPTGTVMDPKNGSTYDTFGLIVPDLPITGKSWPNVIYDLVRMWGFTFRWALDTTVDPPVTRLQLGRTQDGPTKSLYLAARGSDLDPLYSNLGAGGLSRDIADVANAWVVRGAPIRYEVTVLLVAGFPSSAADASAGTIKNFDRSSPLYVSDNRDRYRLFILDETGEGHYTPGSNNPSMVPPSMDPIFDPGTYSGSRLKPIGTLITRDTNRKPYKARLEISTNYTGDKPGFFGGAGFTGGNWQPVADSAWSLLPDRLGISIDGPNPNAWKIGPSADAGAPYPDGIVKVVESLCGAAGSKPFTLRLTCVVESDKCCEYTALRRGDSPLPWAVTRLIDARDRIKKEIVSYSSVLNPNSTDTVKRDDTDKAKAEAVATQLAQQAGELSGPVVIPRFTTYYELGDQITSIEGRNLGFRTDGDPSNKNLVYPVVVKVRWSLGRGQVTTLELSDAGTDRSRFRRAAGRKRDAR